MDYLKPCPFCGGNASVKFRGQSYPFDTWKGFIVAGCNTCGVSTRGSYYHGPEIIVPLADTIGGEKAVNDWNRRINNGD